MPGEPATSLQVCMHFPSAEVDFRVRGNPLINSSRHESEKQVPRGSTIAAKTAISPGMDSCVAAFRCCIRMFCRNIAEIAAPLSLPSVPVLPGVRTLASNLQTAGAAWAAW
jgi:hypothetical protein